VPILPTFADSFPLRGLKARYRNWRLARLLNHPGVEVVTNHHVNACRNLAAIGVRTDKLIPWDFSPSVTPDMFPPRAHAPVPPIKLVWIGPRNVPAKGLRDACDAINLLTQQGIDATLSVIGGTKAEDEALRDLSAQSRPRVRCVGRVAHSDVIRAMRDSDAVLVPSRHEYPEGLPFVIFVGRVEHERSGLIHRAGDPASLASCVARLAREPDLVPRLSANTSAAWERMQVPLKWEELVDAWLSGPLSPEFHAEHGLASFTGR
jgi:hypothetical protein